MSEQQGLSRKRFLGAAALAGGAMALAPGFTRAQTAAAATPAALEPVVEDGLAWYDVEQWGVEGKGWTDTARFYDRLPARAQGVVRPAVWNLSRDSSGLLTRFETDSPAVHARYRLKDSGIAMPHMPATGVSGLDLYARDADGHDRWVGVAQPATRDVERRLIAGADPGSRRYTAYLPLYNGVDSLQIGVEAGADFRPVTPRERKPIVIYGSSIAQGACASRPGMAFPAILGRRFGRPVINLGFSGNALMEPEVGELLGELDPEVFLIDALPNMVPELVAERGEVFVRELRAARPGTPIVMAEDRTYGYAWLQAAARERHVGSRAAYREAYRNMLTSGVKDLIYLEGEDLLGNDDGEAATDGSHPSNLGMVRYADAYTQVLRRVLRQVP